MRKFKTKIEGYGETQYDFVCYENTEPIEIGDKFIFFFGGIADVQICDSENIKSEINKHNRLPKENCIDLVFNFWTKCFKIKSSSNFDLNNLS